MDQSINPGQLKHKITIQTPIAGENEVGEDEPNYITFATPFASIEGLKGTQYLEAKKVRDELTFKVTIRYRSGVTNEMRIKYSKRNEPDRYFLIEDIININELNRMLQIICYEKVYKDVN